MGEYLGSFDQGLAGVEEAADTRDGAALADLELRVVLLTGECGLRPAFGALQALADRFGVGLHAGAKLVPDLFGPGLLPLGGAVSLRAIAVTSSTLAWTKVSSASMWCTAWA